LSYYIDTNIFIYSALANPTYGKACKQIIDDIESQKIKAYCGFLVPIELLGALARIDSDKAALAVDAFFSLPISMIPIDEKILILAAKLTSESGVSYDCVHAACMRSKGVDTVITEDAKDWRKIGGFKIIRSLNYESLNL